MAEMVLLEQLRKEIDQVDDEIMTLLVKRMEIAKKIGRAKGERPVLDPEREQRVLSRLEKGYPQITPAYLEQIYAGIMALCRSVQSRGKA